MTTVVTVNTPPAELMMSFLDRAAASPYAQHTMLAALVPALVAKHGELEALIGTHEKDVSYQRSKILAAEADMAFDEQHRLIKGILDAYEHHADAALREAARYLRDVLYPDGLAIVQASFEVEAASGSVFGKRAALPQAAAAVATLAPELPKLGDHIAAAVAKATALGDALKAFDGVLVDKAGRPTNPALFKVRTEAQRLLSDFLSIVDGFAYPHDTPEHRQAREALGGPYRRFLLVSRSERPTEPTPAPAPTNG